MEWEAGCMKNNLVQCEIISSGTNRFAPVHVRYCARRNLRCGCAGEFLRFGRGPKNGPARPWHTLTVDGRGCGRLAPDFPGAGVLIRERLEMAVRRAMFRCNPLAARSKRQIVGHPCRYPTRW